MAFKAIDIHQCPVWLDDSRPGSFYYRGVLPARATGGLTVQKLGVQLDRAVPENNNVHPYVLALWWSLMGHGAIRGLGVQTVFDFMSIFADDILEFNIRHWSGLFRELEAEGITVILSHEESAVACWEEVERPLMDQPGSRNLYAHAARWQAEQYARSLGMAHPAQIEAVGDRYERMAFNGYEDAKSKLLRERALGIEWTGPILRSCKRHIVATEPLRAWVLQHNPAADIRLGTNFIDPADSQAVERPNDGKVRIGYAATLGHILDLPLILPALKECSRIPGVEIYFFGIHPNWRESRCQGSGVYSFDGYQYTFHELTEHIDAYKKLIGILDVALGPLLDSQYNRAKGSQKWLEHAVHRTPMVVSDLEPYGCVEHGRTGLKAKTPEEFTEHLVRLCTDADLRHRIGEAARAEVLAHHTIQACAEQWRAAVAP